MMVPNPPAPFHEHPFVLCARQELLLAVRSRWTQVFATVFAALSLAVAVSGYVLSGGHGVQDFSRTTASLLQLVLILVPLASLLMGVLTLLPGPRRRGAPLFAARLAPDDPLGRLAGPRRPDGLAADRLRAAGLVIYSNAGDAGLSGFGLLVAGSAVLTAVFLGLGPSSRSDRRVAGGRAPCRSPSWSGSRAPSSSTSRPSAWPRSSRPGRRPAFSSSRSS